ncbi:MAG TPA: winged helix DNA-binding protein [Spirochaetota bacterium]|nr:winged helix DNA-binding protein [Spirochaetota bacterium]HPC39574.1 winged helix DNA-binding protein [Spirochaetota bacterium]HPL19143.1 winged helix DNA-binding protein [Spirochaetota bacterium]HQF09469.1 winged helix DNA-binding protein [Spirochaetota bacterium]HQH98152.1 winged helix DNA-binding protein [Spirochaetota bacterium]
MMLNEQCCHLNNSSGEDNSLTAKELQVLASLNPGESVPIIDLAKRNTLSPSRMSRIIDKLATRGFLRREADEHDRRYSRVSLTEEGISVNHDTAVFRKQCEDKIRARMSETEFAVIQKALRLLIFAMEDDNGDVDADTTRHN